MSFELFHGDCLDVLRGMPDCSVDSIVTDPPYGLSNTSPAQVADALKAWVSGDVNTVPAKRGGFMGKDWDSFVPPPAVWVECLRVLKPGGHMLVFAGSRTQDLMGLSIRLAGFEMRDSLAWIYGSGFPKSMDVSKAIDKAAGAEREVVGTKVTGNAKQRSSSTGEFADGSGKHGGTQVVDVTVPATPEAERWQGFGTALKPAQEPIILARKPLDGTVAANVLAHGVGGLNIDACRVATDWSTDPTRRGWQGRNLASESGVPFVDHNKAESQPNPAGRFPANVLLDEHAAAEMDRQSGHLHAAGNRAKGKGGTYSNSSYAVHYDGIENRVYHDSGGASRFFPVFKYQAKAPKKERPVIEREDGTKVAHPTVKPLALMEWVVTLITPPEGVVLDPFAGSGATIEAAHNSGFRPIAIEQDADYCELIRERMRSK